MAPLHKSCHSSHTSASPHLNQCNRVCSPGASNSKTVFLKQPCCLRQAPRLPTGASHGAEKGSLTLTLGKERRWACLLGERVTSDSRAVRVDDALQGRHAAALGALRVQGRP